MPKCGPPMILISPSKILSLYGKIRIRLCPYTGQNGSGKIRISAYFTQWLGRNSRFKLGWLDKLDFSFFQRQIVIELLVCKIIEKKLSKVLFSKTFFFPTFSFAGSKSSKKQTRDDFLKTAVNKNFLQNSKGKT